MGKERITVSFDEESLKYLEEMLEEKDVSKSELLRKSIKFFYGTERFREYGKEKLDMYLELLSEGEHVVLDVDRWLLFLDMLESHPNKEKFWERSKKIADSHADQLSSQISELEELLERLAACNLFRLSKTSENEFTLLVNSEKARKFVKILLRDFIDSMEFDAEIREDIGKIRIVDKG